MKMKPEWMLRSSTGQPYNHILWRKFWNYLSAKEVMMCLFWSLFSGNLFHQRKRRGDKSVNKIKYRNLLKKKLSVTSEEMEYSIYVTCSLSTFGLSVLKTKLKYPKWPVRRKESNQQSEKNRTSGTRGARDQVVTGVSLACDWLREWRESSGPITEQNEEKPMPSPVTFETQSKIAQTNDQNSKLRARHSKRGGRLYE